MNEELRIIISAEVSKAKKAIEDAKAKISGFKAEVEKAKKDCDANFKTIGEGIKKGL